MKHSFVDATILFLIAPILQTSMASCYRPQAADNRLSALLSKLNTSRKLLPYAVVRLLKRDRR